ncbi:MAG: hypothetical protein GC204_13895 [Chloroflexi bacterium]|nr:hypothetical protein [Chloroflexota bacterium]
MAKKQDDLLNEIMQRRKANQLAQQTDPLARILDDLNAMDALDKLRRRATLCYGPKAIKSALPSIGVVIWQRASGYYGYKTLSLIGLWVYFRVEGEAKRPIIAIGKKMLKFSSPFYDADAYHKLIRDNYNLYYQDDGKPPAQPTYSVAYDSEQRLELRGMIAHEVGKLLQ